jgi:hypothetical protein
MKELAYQLEFIPFETKLIFAMVVAVCIAFVASRRRM